MKKILLIILAFTVQVSLTNCQNKTIETKTYEVTPEFAKSINKPEVHFKVEIPTSLNFDKPQPGKKTSSYGMIQKKNDKNEIIEMCSFGYIDIKGQTDFEDTAKSFLGQVKDMLEGAGYKMEESKIGYIKLDNNDHLALTAIASMDEGLFDEFVGRYYFNAVIRPNPNPKASTQIMFFMSARDDQNINEYKDFIEKLDISTVWETFKYL
ncbi:hypothetical protein ACFQ1Q_01640 [Winogradskyella litorisediminis]|uniref:Lipoprotein n=1 Tax=Winogradskyella litorisediminis TaxID=1156618 RepID=A0ABW3N2Q9_9FLAO